MITDHNGTRTRRDRDRLGGAIHNRGLIRKQGQERG